jgi:hypothetical protein
MRRFERDSLQSVVTNSPSLPSSFVIAFYFGRQVSEDKAELLSLARPPLHRRAGAADRHPAPLGTEEHKLRKPLLAAFFVHPCNMS